MFLTKYEIAKESAIEIDVETLQSLCGKCNLYKNCKSKKMEVTGNGEKGILIIGDKPSETDDQNCMQFSGKSGHLLQEELQRNKINLHRDCWKVNAVRCHTTELLLTTEAKLCSGYIIKQILTLKPKLVILLGNAPLVTVIGEDFSDRDWEVWRGTAFWDEKYETTFFSTMHPKFCTEKLTDKARRNLFSRDIAAAVNSLSKCHRKDTNQEQYVEPVYDLKQLKDVLTRKITNGSTILIDLETSGLKPYRNGHFIASVGIATSSKKAYTFPYKFNSFWRESQLNEIRSMLLSIMRNKSILKVSHNTKFEDSWLSHDLNVAGLSWAWCTMLTTHVMDSRTSYTGLKLQSFLNFGKRPYDKHLKHLLESDEGGEFNKVHKVPIKELLMYNGLDVIYGYMLLELQKSKLAGRKGLLHANSFFFQGSMAMGKIQRNGICMDEKYYRNQRIVLSQKINIAKKRLEEGTESKLFKERFGRQIKMSSGQDLGKLFFEVLEHPAVYTSSINKKTGKFNYKTDADTMAKLNIPFAKDLVGMKKLIKARDTYLAQFDREVFNGEMHPFFDLHLARSLRSSSSKPNFQNMPARDVEIKEAVRKGIIPKYALDLLSEIDFSGAEVITSVCYHKDPTFLAYLRDKSTDMHRDQAIDLWKLPDGILSNPEYTREQAALAKKIRFFAKNNWTFAQFYGDWYDSCAKNLWESCIVQGKLKLPTGQLLYDHCASVGMYSLDDFVAHCRGVEDRLWNERFPVYTKWKKSIYNFYLKYGYIETFFGFRFIGLMNEKQCSNYPIQGTSFHNLVAVILLVDKFLIENKMETKIIGQIHDSIVSNVVPDEVETYHVGVSNIISTLHERHKWMVMPMEAECAISKPKNEGGNISKMFSIKPKFLDGSAKFSLPEIYK